MGTRMLVLMVFVAVLGGCAAQHKAGPGEPARDDKVLEAKRNETAAKLKAMTVPQLADRLAADSLAGREPFNSPAYREAVRRGGPDANALAGQLKAKDRSSLLGLLALRKMDAARYKALDSSFRTQVLVDALRNSKSFNAWGIPHLFWEDAAKALIEEKAEGAKALAPLLKDRRPAPVWGSESAVEASKYHYRVCDYAWALINDAEGRRVEIPVKPEERDALIEKK
jgi:hypothetical protein